MPILKTINLTPETHKIWEENFAGTEEFSGFIQQCLIDLKAKKNSKGYLLEQMAEKEAQKAQIDKEITHIRNKLTDLHNEEAEKAIVKPTKMNKAEMEKELSKMVNSIRMHTNGVITPEQASPLAKDYLSIPEDTRPKLYDYLLAKGMVKPRPIRKEVSPIPECLLSERSEVQ